MVPTRAVWRGRWALPVAAAGFATATLLTSCAGWRSVQPPPPVPGPTPVGPPALTSFSVGVGAPWLAVAPDGRRVYAVNGNLTIIDTAANAVLDARAVDAATTHIAIAPDGSRLYMTGLMSGMLTVYDTVRDELTTPVKLYEPYFHGRLAAAPDNRSLYVADTQRRALAIIDVTRGRSRLLTPSVAPYDVAVSRDGRTVYGAGCKKSCAPGYIQRFDAATQEFGAELQIAANPFRIILSPDGQRAYVVHLGPPSVSVVDLGAWRVIATVPLPRTASELSTPNEAAISPDGATLYVTAQQAGKVIVIDTASAAVRAQLAVPLAYDVALAPDGSRLYVSTAGEVAKDLTAEEARKGLNRGREFGDMTAQISGSAHVLVLATRPAQ
ncbi:MAG: YncE family protein [Candidatus Binatia bacterium]